MRSNIDGIKNHSIYGGMLGAALALAFLAATACSLGGSPGGGGGSPSYSKGLISAKGSVWVNGIEYDTRSASIMVNGSTGTDSDLKVGMVVEVKGKADDSLGKGSAQRIYYTANLSGPVSAIAASTMAFTVFGQTVGVDASTVWDGTSGLAGSSPLSVGDRVEVSGYADGASGALVASRVEKSLSSQPSMVKGSVSSLAAGSLSLTVANPATALTIDFSGTLDPAIANGSVVDIWFTSISGTVVSTTAAFIRTDYRLDPDDRMRSEVGGIVSLFAPGSPATFTIDEVKVSADPGLLPPGFGNGVRAEVKGTAMGGILVADRVKIEQEANAAIKGQVSAVSTALGAITVDGVLLTVDSRTIFRDENGSGGAAPDAFFDLSKLSVGDYVEACGLYSPTGSPSFTTYKVERLAPSSQAELRGTASAASATSLTMFGLPVDIGAATFKDKNGLAVASGSAFAALVTVNSTVVDAVGTYVPGSPGSLTASAARIGETD